MESQQPLIVFEPSPKNCFLNIFQKRISASFTIRNYRSFLSEWHQQTQYPSPTSKLKKLHLRNKALGTKIREKNCLRKLKGCEGSVAHDSLGRMRRWLQPPTSEGALTAWRHPQVEDHRYLTMEIWNLKHLAMKYPPLQLKNIISFIFQTKKCKANLIGNLRIVNCW